jgi:hypothetical protein
MVSLSDVLTVLDMGQKLKHPYNTEEIINVIPIFDDDRIHKFLRKYAPTILEYICSIGMRRIISDIPNT